MIIPSLLVKITGARSKRLDGLKKVKKICPIILKMIVLGKFGNICFSFIHIANYCICFSF